MAHPTKEWLLREYILQHHSLPIKITLIEVLDLISLAVNYIADKDYKAFHRGIREVVCSNPDLITQDEKIFVDQFILYIQALSFPVR
jgi:hypothetical protein